MLYGRHIDILIKIGLELINQILTVIWKKFGKLENREF